MVQGGKSRKAVKKRAILGRRACSRMGSQERGPETRAFLREADERKTPLRPRCRSAMLAQHRDD